MTQEFDVIIIGGGATGGGTALDLALRGLRVALVERADLTDGTSGRYHGLLHSGGRYAVRDPESARECIEENRILRRIVPHAIEDTGGFFVTTPDDDPTYADKWLKACHECDIEAAEISVAQMLKEEPALNPAITRAFRVPDASSDSFDVLTALGAAIQAQHGTVLTYHEVVGLTVAGGKVTGATVRNRRTGDERHLAARAGRQRRGRVGRSDRGYGRLPGDRAPQQGHDGRDGVPVRQHHHQPLPPARRRRHPGPGRHRGRDRHDLRQRARPERHQHPGLGGAQAAGRGRKDGARLQPGARRCAPGRASGRCTKKAARRRAAKPSAPSPCWIMPSATASAD